MIKKDLHDCENSAKKEITFKTNNKNGVKNIDMTSLKKELVYTLTSSPCKTESETFLENEKIRNKNKIKSEIKNQDDDYENSPQSNLFTPILSMQNITIKSKSQSPRK
jgi:hypothetical protein